jgi:hypothetical protein
MKYWLSIIVVLVITQFAQAAALSTLEVFPAQVNLNTSADKQSLVVLATLDDGTTQDVTAKATLKLDNAGLVNVNKNILLPKANGETKLQVSYDGKQVEVAVRVVDAGKPRPISFKLDVMPVFMKSGCNTGSCHGSSSGQDGFRLSLFGFDPDGDYHRITRQMGPRRLNLAMPEQSLMMQKVLGLTGHTGGKRFEKGSEYYQSLMDWLYAGAPKDDDKVAKPTSIEILPRYVVLEGEKTTQQLTVRAKYSDGSDRDVTTLAVFSSSNATSALIDAAGQVTAASRGEAFIMARFATFAEVSQVVVIPKGLDYKRPEYPANNYIDQLVSNKLHKLRVIPSQLCSDEVFLRRAYLDICGVLPTPAEYERFIAAKETDKRDKLVDELLGRKEFAEMWVMKWAELLQIRQDDIKGVSYKSTLLYYNWLQKRIANNVPFNQIVQELLSSTGGTFTNPATNYYQNERDTLKVSENVAQVFMGMRIQCSQCHNHPFDRWTMNDYYSFASFFTQIGRKGAEDPRETIVFNSGSGEMKHPVTRQTMKPKFLGGKYPDLKGMDRRKALATWLASPENPYFARNLANMVWGHFFGVGITDPVDDVRVSNPPSNPQLLDELAKRFTEYNYDVKRMVRDICTSRSYQLSTQLNDTNKGDGLNFSHALIRRVRAEVLLDMVTQITETKNKFQGLPLGARAVQIANGNVSNYFLTTFGRATRKTVCSCEVKMEPNLSQALHLLNGDVVNKRIKEGAVVKKMIDAKKTPQQMIENLYLLTLSRKPDEKESAALIKAVTADPKQQQQVLEDTFWALMNAKEFLFNH